MYVDRAYTDVDVVRPDCVNQFLPAEDLARILKKVSQQIELGQSEMNFMPVVTNTLANEVHL